MFKRVSARSVAALCAAALLVGCSPPAQQAVGNASAGLFFKVPPSWTKIDDRLVNAAQNGWLKTEAGVAVVKTSLWFEIWTGSQSIDVNEALSNSVVEDPVVIATVRSLLPVEKQNLGADIKVALQDLVVPVSTAVEGDGLDIASSERFAFAGYEGLQQLLRWDVDGATQTYRILSLIDPKRTYLYLLVARCSDICFSQNEKTIDSVIKSIALKEPIDG